MFSLRNISDQKLKMALAVEVFGWLEVQKNSEGQIVGYPSNKLVEAPLILPDFTGSSVAVSRLEKNPRLIESSKLYLQLLQWAVGDVSDATPRQRCEAILMAFRETSACSA
jgi:hypothetical protein